MPPTLKDRARAVLHQVYGYDAFRDWQEAIIGHVLAGEHALVVMPTGGGKSLCYQIPALMRRGVGLVVSPLIALMKDQVDALRQLGVRAAVINSSLDPAERAAAEHQLRTGQLDMVYVAPERLLTSAFLALLTQTDIALIAIDEAHCIAQWGHDFRPEYLQLSRLRKRFAHVPCIAVTATADKPTQDEICRQLDIPAAGVFITGFDRPNIQYRVAVKTNQKRQLLRLLQGEHARDAGIVYCLSRKQVDHIAAWLASQGRAALPYHAGLPREMRYDHQNRFLREESVIVVATIAFGMGIDKPDVRFVAHLTIPQSLEAYYQETGRAGRDGLPATAWMAYGLGDVVTLRRIQESSESTEQHRMAQRHKLNAMVGYCEATACRRQIVLNYFGEPFRGPCNNCDNCLHPVDTWDGTMAAQKVLSCIYRTKQRFGSGHIIDILLGNATDKVLHYRHQSLSTFGIGNELSATEWRSVIRQLVAGNFLDIDVAGYGVLRLTSASGSVLRGEQRVAFRRDPRSPRTAKKRLRQQADGVATTDRALFVLLKKVRSELAAKQGVPAYHIFGDRTLVEMAARRPRSLREFQELHGVGAVKRARYGPMFLAAIRQYESDRS